MGAPRVSNLRLQVVGDLLPCPSSKRAVLTEHEVGGEVREGRRCQLMAQAAAADRQLGPKQSAGQGGALGKEGHCEELACSRPPELPPHPASTSPRKGRWSVGTGVCLHVLLWWES